MNAGVRWIESAAALAALHEPWLQAWQADPEADLFAHPLWFASWWRNFADGAGGGLQLHLGEMPIELPVRRRRLLVGAVEEAGRLRAVWPLSLVTTRWRRCRVEALALPTNRHAPRAGLLLGSGDAGLRAARLDALVAALRDRRDWDLFLHDGLPSLSGLDALAARHEPCGGFAHSRLTLDGDWDDFLRRQGRHFRQRLSQPRQALEELGPVRIERVDHADRLPAALADFDRIEAGSWKADAGETVAGSDARGHYRELVQGFGELGACHFWLLYIGAVPAAAFLCIALRGTVYLLKTSYQLRFASARHAPSRVLLGRLIEHYWRGDGWRLLDCVGRMPFVERWTPELLPLPSRIGYRTGLRALAPYWLGRTRRWTAAMQAAAHG